MGEGIEKKYSQASYHSQQMFCHHRGGGQAAGQLSPASTANMSDPHAAAHSHGSKEFRARKRHRGGPYVLFFFFISAK